MQYDQRVLRPHSAPKPTLNQITLLFLVVLVFVFLIERAYGYIDKRSHDDKSARDISKTFRSRVLELERFFYGQREHSRQSALRHHRLAKKRERCIRTKADI